MEYEAQKRLFLANHEYSPFFTPITISQHFQVLVSGNQALTLGIRRYSRQCYGQSELFFLLSMSLKIDNYKI
ncbi:MAG: hypothetical protein RLZZ574_450 [Cyanobacteriota bacterium]|jgi:hypothetical protein